MKEIYLAGGCFWGIEEMFRGADGVISTQCCYVNGDSRLIPDYMLVCSGKFGYREAVRVEYDPGVLPLERILEAFFMAIDPEQGNGQGNDIGTQYHTGVYWTDAESEHAVREFMSEESGKHREFHTECGPLMSFSPAEDGHQKYLMRNPSGYCHISRGQMDAVKGLLRRSVR